MKLDIVLAAISIIVIVGPLLAAVITYKENPIALVMPDIQEISNEIKDYVPKVEYVGYEIIDPESSFRVKFNVMNNAD